MHCATAQDSQIAVDQKNLLRRKVRDDLKPMSEEDQQNESALIAESVLASEYFRCAKRAGVYLHCPRLREVDTSRLIREAMLQGGTKCFVPKVLDRHSNMQLLHLDSFDGLVPVPPFNILEPTPLYSDSTPREDVMDVGEPLDLLLMPGLAFDRSGRRCGRGGGYYDKLLTALQRRAAQHGWKPPLLVALAFRAQLVEEVPVAANDKDVDIIVTPDSQILCSERARMLMGIASG